MKHELSIEAASYPLDGLFERLDTDPLEDFAFSTNHHRASERGRMEVARLEHGDAAALDEGGF